MCSMCFNTYHNLYPLLLHRSLIIGGVTNSHQRVYVKSLQLLADIKKVRVSVRLKTHTADVQWWNSVVCKCTSVNLLSVALVGLWVMRNLMHSWTISTAAGRFMLARRLKKQLQYNTLTKQKATFWLRSQQRLLGYLYVLRVGLNK